MNERANTNSPKRRRGLRAIAALSLCAAATAVASLVSGCHSFELNTPDGFVELESSQYEYQASDAEGVVVAVREFDAHDASQDFWEHAVASQLQRMGNYTLLEATPVTSLDGTQGKLLSFERKQPGQVLSYSVAVFVKEDPFLFVERSRVFVVESGGDSAAYEKRRAELTASLSSLDLDLLW